jgi:DNA polymerase I-like protein with 3'-5' exonuclease and polymerase domains
MRRSQTVFEPTSTPLEDRVPVTFRLVGSQQWFANDFESRAVRDEEKIVISDPVQLQPILAEIRRMRMVGVDTETTGPYHSADKRYATNPINEDCRIVLLQIGNKDKVWIIQPALIEHFRDMLENTDQLHLAHNWQFDFKWLLHKNNIHPRRLYCSMLAEQLLTAGLVGHKVGLADCARKYKPYWIISKAVRSQFIHLDDGKMTRSMVKYAARDIPLLFGVFDGQIKELKKYDLNFVAQLEFDNIPVAVEMEVRGFYLDPDKLKWIVAYWTRLQKDMELEILKQYTDIRKAKGQVAFIVPEWLDVFDLNSNKEKLEALRNIGVALGSNDVKRATLLETKDPIAKLLAEYSHVLKMTSTYGDNLRKKINKRTGLYYPRFAQLGFGSAGEDGRDNKETTATGRWAGDAQQFPRNSDGIYADPLIDENGVDEGIAIEKECADLIAMAERQIQQKGEGSACFPSNPGQQ